MLLHFTYNILASGAKEFRRNVLTTSTSLLLLSYLRFITFFSYHWIFLQLGSVPLRALLGSLGLSMVWKGRFLSYVAKLGHNPRPHSGYSAKQLHKEKSPICHLFPSLSLYTSYILPIEILLGVNNSHQLLNLFPRAFWWLWLSLTGVKVSDCRAIARWDLTGPSQPSIPEWLLVFTTAFSPPNHIGQNSYRGGQNKEVATGWG